MLKLVYARCGGYDGQGWTEYGCVLECRFYADAGRIEDEDVIARFKEWEQKQQQQGDKPHKKR